MTLVAYLVAAWAASVPRRYDDVCGWMDDVGRCLAVQGATRREGL